MSNGKKIAVALTRAFAGVYGVDCFIMGCTGRGVKAIITTVVLNLLYFPLMIVNIIPYVGQIIYLIGYILLTVCILIRGLVFLITGLTYLAKTPEDVEMRY